VVVRSYCVCRFQRVCAGSLAIAMQVGDDSGQTAVCRYTYAPSYNLQNHRAKSPGRFVSRYLSLDFKIARNLYIVDTFQAFWVMGFFSPAWSPNCLQNRKRDAMLALLISPQSSSLKHITFLIFMVFWYQ